MFAPNKSRLFSDACTSEGMGGVLLFHEGPRREKGVDGIFWQVSWIEWQRITGMTELHPGSVRINIAEFLAALITCETFADHCAGLYSTLVVDTTAARH